MTSRIFKAPHVYRTEAWGDVEASTSSDSSAPGHFGETTSLAIDRVERCAPPSAMAGALRMAFRGSTSPDASASASNGYRTSAQDAPMAEEGIFGARVGRWCVGSHPNVLYPPLHEGRLEHAPKAVGSSRGFGTWFKQVWAAIASALLALAAFVVRQRVEVGRSRRMLVEEIFRGCGGRTIFLGRFEGADRVGAPGTWDLRIDGTGIVLLRIEGEVDGSEGDPRRVLITFADVEPAWLVGARSVELVELPSHPKGA